MRTAILMLVVLLLLVSVPSAWASIVIHGDAPGIVAHGSGGVLDSMGRVWQVWDNTWTRDPLADPPVPVSLIKFWELWGLVTTSNEYWGYDPSSHVWTQVGQWPGTASAEETEPSPHEPSTFPNPTSSACRVTFSSVSEGPITVEIFDATGRIVRRLLDGPHPAGDYSLKWDGKDDAGRELPAGVYFTHVTTADGTTTGRVVLAR